MLYLYMYMYMFVCLFFNLEFFCKAASIVGPYGLFWQPALVCYSSILYLCLLIGQIKMLACLLVIPFVRSDFASDAFSVSSPTMQQSPSGCLIMR